ncbi:MAG: hypothetical protein LBO06_04385, partial [Bacteroidales bacterium]|nr:hypothetical protein [Bacteroidales bacterium]
LTLTKRRFIFLKWRFNFMKRRFILAKKGKKIGIIHPIIPIMVHIKPKLDNTTALRISYVCIRHITCIFLSPELYKTLISNSLF